METQSPITPGMVDSLRLWDRSGVSLLTGRSGIYSLALLWQVDLFLEGLRPHIIDCAVRGNVFTVADEALRRNLAPEAVLRALTIQRAFSPYQILDVMHGILSAPQPAERRVHVILAPAKQFFDGDVAAEEGAFLLRRLVTVMEEFPRRGLPLLIVEKDNYPHPVFPEILERMRRISAPVYELKLVEKQFREACVLRISGGGAAKRTPRPQKPVRSGGKYGSNTPSLLHADRTRERTISRISSRIA